MTGTIAQAEKTSGAERSGVQRRSAQTGGELTSSDETSATQTSAEATSAEATSAEATSAEATSAAQCWGQGLPPGRGGVVEHRLRPGEQPSLPVSRRCGYGTFFCMYRGSRVAAAPRSLAFQRSTTSCVNSTSLFAGACTTERGQFSM